MVRAKNRAKIFFMDCFRSFHSIYLEIFCIFMLSNTSFLRYSISDSQCHLSVIFNDNRQQYNYFWRCCTNNKHSSYVWWFLKRASIKKLGKKLFPSFTSLNKDAYISFLFQPAMRPVVPAFLQQSYPLPHSSTRSEIPGEWNQYQPLH